MIEFVFIAMSQLVLPEELENANDFCNSNPYWMESYKQCLSRGSEVRQRKTWALIADPISEPSHCFSTL